MFSFITDGGVPIPIGMNGRGIGPLGGGPGSGLLSFCGPGMGNGRGIGPWGGNGRGIGPWGGGGGLSGLVGLVWCSGLSKEGGGGGGGHTDGF